MPQQTYEAVVVGAGPAGIAAVANLLEHRITPILWVDDAFDGGRINKYYRGVPSNTKVKVLIEFLTAVIPFRSIMGNVHGCRHNDMPLERKDVPSSPNTNELQQQLQYLDPDHMFPLSIAADACLMLTRGLETMSGVVTQLGTVVEAFLDENAGQWTVRVDTALRYPGDVICVRTQRIILCTGSSPRQIPLPTKASEVRQISLDTALSSEKLSDVLELSGATNVAVIGASHSAILVLRTLANLALERKSDLKILWFTRHDLVYAEYEDGYIARDNTGLKGEAAAWARLHLEVDMLPTSPVSRYIKRITCDQGTDEDIYSTFFPEVEIVIQAIGFIPNPMPRLATLSGNKEISPTFDHSNGHFTYHEPDECRAITHPTKIPGLYGSGIAFPGAVTDPKYGHIEMNVGLNGFMQTIKKWIPGWD